MELKERIITECKNIPPEVIKEASMNNLQKRLNICFNQRGRQFEHLL